MELLNISFAILILKITFCVLPGALGVFLIVSSKETKRKIRNKVCCRLFRVSNAIPSRKFARFLYFVGALLVVFSLAASWFIVLRAYVGG